MLSGHTGQVLAVVVVVTLVEVVVVMLVLVLVLTLVLVVVLLELLLLELLVLVVRLVLVVVVLTKAHCRHVFDPTQIHGVPSPVRCTRSPSVQVPGRLTTATKGRMKLATCPSTTPGKVKVQPCVSRKHSPASSCCTLGL